MAMVQYSCWNNCNGSCDFCLRKERSIYSVEDQIFSLETIMKNIDLVDWKGKFSDGISLLGGELYNITDQKLQDTFMKLVDKIIDNILLQSTNPNCKFSSVTNGVYDPSFLFRVLDRVKERAGIQFIDINFSYDLKYRYKNEDMRKQAISNINAVHKRYDYCVGVQMILAQYVLNMINSGEFSIDKFLKEEIPGNMLCFLYPHPIHTGKILRDFYLKRKDFLNFLLKLRDEHPSIYTSFVFSTRNSGEFKYTGLVDKRFITEHTDTQELPSLSDGKEIINPQCGHSSLYRCYIDSSACILCDIEALEGATDSL